MVRITQTRAGVYGLASRREVFPGYCIYCAAAGAVDAAWTSVGAGSGGDVSGGARGVAAGEGSSGIINYQKMILINRIK